ncbi:uncharacterized protein NECHADRAFT_88869 [Fusarium vanettenii 77-13-4]|uniref:Uncharacterized protein n=1 Tax=Fusarium vanettenii (strain ATCC MYA-4622 / CBS 123669 / FGSC 9596 / NRRL 45880 / 77-13-4) TaxID=660122 RepID=C7ZN53_FUSV7|nr:uncharacterized protein NECHADRAFT_88869 [Fusarium vanettenii 77-13-4]EEU34561.1 predicted protein [Fusarium vanettenii 77-13-4]
MLGPRPTPPVVQRDGFQLRQGHFTRINGDIGRVSGSRLKELFDPSSLQLEQDRIEAERTAQQLFTKKFFSAQLSHYGLRHPRNIKNPNSGHFRELLREAVLNGKCDQVPERVTNLKHAMELELEPIHQQWVIDVEAWEATKRQEEEEALHNKSPGEKANIDVNWFMDYYFLTNGKPDRTKTSEPLALHGYSDLGRNICALVDRVPGLAWARSGTRFETTLCIGWGHKAVQALAEKLTAEAWAARRKREKTDRENAMNAHQDYLSQSNQGGSSRDRPARAANQSPQTLFDLGQCRGSYVVESNTLLGAWEEMVEEVGCGSTATRPLFTLDIRDSKVAGILIAAVDFGTFQGAMILSDSKRKLRDLLRSEGETDEFSDRDYDGEYGTEDDEDEEDDEDDESDIADDEDWESDPPRKRQKTTPSASRRIFFRTPGCDAGEYYSDPQPGYLDFSNDGYASFCGQCLLAEEADVDLKGYKVSDVPAPAKRGGDFEWPL